MWHGFSLHSLHEPRASFWAPFAVVLFFAASPALAWTPRASIFYGVAQRPFPALFQIDYPLCRAEAWLNALAMAGKGLPGTLNAMQMGVSGALARDAVAGMLYPVDVVTPAGANSKEIRVFLKSASNRKAVMDSLAPDPLPFLLKMCIIWETAETAAKLRRAWPASVMEARGKIPELDSLAMRLDQLWQAWNLSGKDLPAALESAAILLIKALEAQGAPAGSASAEEAIRLLLAREAASGGGGNTALWNHLAAHAIYLRALGEEKQGQPALAESDYGSVIARLKKSALPDNLAPRALLARAGLRRQSGNIQGMCADYNDACGFGECQGLAAARRLGECGKP